VTIVGWIQTVILLFLGFMGLYLVETAAIRLKIWLVSPESELDTEVEAKLGQGIVCLVIVVVWLIWF